MAEHEPHGTLFDEPALAKALGTQSATVRDVAYGEGVQYSALQNVGLEVVLKAGRADAEYSSRLLGAVDPMSVKHTVENEAAEERTHPTFFPLLEQWEQHAQAIQTLGVGEAFVRLPDDRVRRVKTPTLPTFAVSSQQLTAVQEHYLQRYFRPVPQSAPATGHVAPAVREASTPEPPPIRRHHPDEQDGSNPAPAATSDVNETGTVFALGPGRGPG